MTWAVRVALLVGLFVSAVGIQAIVATTVEARPGGGHTTSGRSSSPSRSSPSRSSPSRSSPSRSSPSRSSPSRSSGTSSYHYTGGGGGCDDSGCNDGGGALFGMFLAVFVIVIITVSVSRSSEQTQTWTSPALDYSVLERRPVRHSVDLAPLLAVDPDFSRAVFEDFAYQLYSQAHRARNDIDKLVALQPYLSQRVMDHLVVRGGAPSQVVIGTLAIERYNPAQSENEDHQIIVYVEATHHTSPPVYVIETWTFVRRAGVVSKPPVRARTWPCPNCGAPWEATSDRKCQHCGEDVKIGRFDWCVDWIAVRSEAKALASLTGTVEEIGNDFPTVQSDDWSEQLAAITRDDPEVTFAAFQQRVHLIYRRLNDAWNANDLGLVRGFVTTALRTSLQYWLDEYARQNLRNQLTDAQIGAIEPAKVTRDKYFDAITVRIRASGCDFTLENGKLVGGSRTTKRDYTEYWTFIRSSSRRGKITTEPACPNCGAPIQISDTGDCTYCNAAVETGEFDWLLSKIEQDDNYAG